MAIMQSPSPAASPAPRPDNLLIGRLREDDWQRLLPRMKLHHLGQGDVLQKAGDSVTRTWFPCGTASAGYRVWSDPGTAAVDVVSIGQEGAIGGIVSNGHVPAYATAEVRSAGTFVSFRTTDLERAKQDSLALRYWFARYADCLVAQLFQNSACNASHTIRQRAARWLLTMAARTRSEALTITHEDLSGLLGVGRSFVTRTLKDLRTEGLIDTRRGRIVLCDCAGLKALSCPCSEQIAAHFDAVLSGIYPVAPDSDGAPAPGAG